MFQFTKVTLSCLILLFGLSLFAEQVVQEQSQEPPQELGLFGDWYGFKSAAFKKGVDLELVYKGEINRNLGGGLKVGTIYLDNLDIKATTDLQKILNLNNTLFFVHLLGNSGADAGGKPSTFVGDEQVTSNIETPVNSFKIYSLWLQKKFDAYKTSLLFGLYDLNSEFYVTEASGSFLNSSFGVGRELSQTGINGPSIFPTTATAFRFKIEPVEKMYYQLGVFGAQAGDPDAPRDTHIRLGTKEGFLIVSELGLHGLSAESDNYALGLWTYTEKFDHLTETTLDALGNIVPVKSSCNGAYFIMNKSLNENISTFLRYGVAASQTNSVKDDLSAGIVLNGIISTQHNDSAGVAFTRVTAGKEKKDLELSGGNTIKDDETTFELFYKAKIRDGFSIQPDIQYVANPGFASSPEYAIDSAIRIELSF